MPDKSKPHVVEEGPFVVANDAVNDVSVEFFARQDFEDLRFSEVRIIEDDGKDLRMALAQERARNPGGAAAGESDFLAERKLGQASDDLIFGETL
jgi:hypothetical protein